MDREKDLRRESIAHVREALAKAPDGVLFDFERVVADRELAYDNLTLVQERCSSLMRLVRELRAMLRENQWADAGRCPECGASSTLATEHHEGCKLIALLRKQ